MPKQSHEWKPSGRSKDTIPVKTCGQSTNGQTKKSRTNRCTKAADRPRPDGDFTCRRWMIGGVVAMNPTDTTISNDWMTHGFCPRNLSPSLYLRRHDGNVVLRLNNANVYLAIICALLSIGCFSIWWRVRWGMERSDIQMKWIVLGAACLFAVLVVFSSLLTNYRFKNYGQSLTIDSGDGVAIIGRCNNIETIPLQRINGFQMLTRTGDAQLNILFEANSRVERRWIHTDLTWHIELLAKAFESNCNIPVVSRIDKRLNKTG
jgi:hypothetical protein